MKKFLFLFSILLTLHCAIWAQSMTTWTWNNYGLSFKAPSNLIIETNTDTSFLAQSSTIKIGIDVLNNIGSTITELAEELGTIAEEYQMSLNSEVGSLHLTNLTGVYIDGMIGMDNCILAIVANEQSNIAVFVVIIYDDIQYELSNKILNSFSKK